MTHTKTVLGTGELISPLQAAQALELSPRTLERWRAHGLGPPYVRVGRRIRYLVCDITAWVERGREIPPGHASGRAATD